MPIQSRTQGSETLLRSHVRGSAGLPMASPIEVSPRSPTEAPGHPPDFEH